MSETFQQVGTRVGALVEEKNAAYGSSFETAPAALGLLYPNGIAPSQMADALLLVRIWDKQMRIATDRDALGENPYQDIAGYGILGVALHQSKETPSCPGSARRPDALDSSKAHPASAASQRSEPTTTNVDEIRSATRSLSPNASSANISEPKQTSPTSAPIPAATGLAPSVEVALAGARNQNRRNMCANCNRELPKAVRVELRTFGNGQVIPGDAVVFDNGCCLHDFRALLDSIR